MSKKYLFICLAILVLVFAGCEARVRLESRPTESQPVSKSPNQAILGEIVPSESRSSSIPAEVVEKMRQSLMDGSLDVGDEIVSTDDISSTQGSCNASYSLVSISEKGPDWVRILQRWNTDECTVSFDLMLTPSQTEKLMRTSLLLLASYDEEHSSEFFPERLMRVPYDISVPQRGDGRWGDTSRWSTTQCFLHLDDVIRIRNGAPETGFEVSLVNRTHPCTSESDPLYASNMSLRLLLEDSRSGTRRLSMSSAK